LGLHNSLFYHGIYHFRCHTELSVLFKDHTSDGSFIAQKTAKSIKYAFILKKMRIFENGTAVAQTVLSWTM
jgi:hypothetical protein